MSKSNQLTRVLQLHLGKSMNLARIRFLSLMILALYKVQSVNFEKLATAFDSKAKRESSLRRIQRFICQYALPLDLVARLIFTLLPHRPPYSLLLDRTNWKSGSTEINILMLSIAYQGVSFPILFSLLPGKGSSSSEQRILLLERYIQLFGKQTILYLMADREFTGESWLSFLHVENIKYFIRIKDKSVTINSRNGKRIHIRGIFNRLAVNHVQFIPESFIIHGNECYLSALCFINDKGQKDLLVIISLENNHNSLELYRDRWQIETMFRGFKSSGFNIEATHLRDIHRVEKLLAIVMIAFTWAYITGVYRSEHQKEIKIMKHGRRAKSFFKYGLEFIVQALMNPNKSKLFWIALKILSCTKITRPGNIF